jgi:hypothetical protein
MWRVDLLRRLVVSSFGKSARWLMPCDEEASPELSTINAVAWPPAAVILKNERAW